MDNLCNIIVSPQAISLDSVYYVSVANIYNYIQILFKRNIRVTGYYKFLLESIDSIHFNKHGVTNLIQFRCLLRRYLLEISQLNYRSNNATLQTRETRLAATDGRVNREIRRSLSAVLPSPSKEEIV